MDESRAEADELSNAEPEVRDRLDAALSGAIARRPLRLNDTGDINPELLETLRALGYVDE